MKQRFGSRLAANSIQITIALSYSLLLLFTIVVLGATALVLIRDTLEATTVDFTTQLVGQVRDGIDNYLAQMNAIADALLADEPVRAMLDAPEDSAAREAARSVLRTVGATRPDISLLAVVGRDYEPLFHSGSVQANPNAQVFGQQWYRAALAATGPVYSAARVQNLARGEYRWVITLSQAIPHPSTEAVLLVDLNFRVVEQLARSVDLGANGYLFLADASGALIYHPQQQLIFSDLASEPVEQVLAGGRHYLPRYAGGETRLYITDVVERSGWRVIASNSLDQLLAGERRLRSVYLSWAALCFAFVLLLTLLLSRRISLPLRRLRASMQAVEHGSFEIDLPGERTDEIGALTHDFRIMVRKVHELMERNRAEQEHQRRSELRALQMQITPHFLYNTLDSIVWMAEGGHTEGVIEMTTNLAQLLRQSIGRGDALVPLSSELEHLRHYMAIQHVRYRDRLRYAIDAEPATLAARLPRVTLQPLVENAIYHGIRQRDDAGHVSVSARIGGTFAHIMVHDDGPGMSPEQLDRIMTGTEEPEGLGLRNVIDRLALTYQRSDLFTIESSAAAGTSVLLRIPMELEA